MQGAHRAASLWRPIKRTSRAALLLTLALIVPVAIGHPAQAAAAAGIPSATAADEPYVFVTKWGQAGAGDGSFAAPNVVGVDADGAVYVWDTGNKRIQVFDAAGTFLRKWSLPVGPLTGVVAGQSHVYALESPSTVWEYDSNGTLLKKFSANASGGWQLCSPLDVATNEQLWLNCQFAYSNQWSVTAVWPDGNAGWNVPFMHVVDLAVGGDPQNDPYLYRAEDQSYPPYQSWISVFRVWGSPVQTLARWLTPGTARDIAIDGDGHVLQTDVANHNVQVYTTGGFFLGVFGVSGSGALGYPSGLAFAPNGDVYVGDALNNQILRYKPGPFVVSIDVAVTGPVQAGEPFTVTATARDPNGATADFNGAGTWSSLDGVLGPASPATFVHGVSTTTATIAAPFRADKITVNATGVSGQSASFDVIGPVSRVAVGVAQPVIATVPFTITARATDTAGNTVGAYSGSAFWSSLDGALAPAVPADFVNGVSTTTTATIPAGFEADTIAITTGGVSGESSAFDVIAPSTIWFKFPSGIDAGASFTLKAFAGDSSGHVLTAFSAAARWSDLSGALSPATPAPFVNGVSTTQVTIPPPVHGDRITLTSGGLARSSGSFNVYGPIAAITTRVSAPVTTGSPFTFKAFAMDAAGNTLPDYDAPATWSDRSGTLSPPTPSPFVNGVSSSDATIPTAFHGDTITVSSGGVSRTTGAFNVFGPLAKIAIRVTTPVTHWVPFTIKATATDSAGNTLTGYNAAASWSDLSGSLSPAAPSPFVNGQSTTTATVTGPYPNDRITVTSGISGLSGYFNVH